MQATALVPDVNGSSMMICFSQKVHPARLGLIHVLEMEVLPAWLEAVLNMTSNDYLVERRLAMNQS